MSVRNTFKNGLVYLVAIAMIIATIVVLAGLLLTYYWALIILFMLAIIGILAYKFVYINRLKENPYESETARIYKY
jgi:hypothetical protein